MGKELRRQHLGYFSARMKEHTAVSDCKAIYSKDHYLFKIELLKGGSINVLLTDAYQFSLADTLLMPENIDYVVMGMPHAGYSEDAARVLKANHIGIGKIGKFMGAINTPKPWEYRTPEERKEDQKEK